MSVSGRVSGHAASHRRGSGAMAVQHDRGGDPWRSQFRAASYDPNSDYLQGCVPVFTLDWLDGLPAIKSRRTDRSSGSDGRSLSPRKCFITARNECAGLSRILWSHFQFDNTGSELLGRIESLLEGHEPLDRVYVGISRYLRRRFMGDFPLRMPAHETTYDKMAIIAFVSMGAGSLEHEALSFLEGSHWARVLQNRASAGGGHAPEKPGFLYVCFSSASTKAVSTSVAPASQGQPVLAAPSPKRGIAAPASQGQPVLAAPSPKRGIACEAPSADSATRLPKATSASTKAASASFVTALRGRLVLAAPPRIRDMLPKGSSASTKAASTSFVTALRAATASDEKLAEKLWGFADEEAPVLSPPRARARAEQQREKLAEKLWGFSSDED